MKSSLKIFFQLSLFLSSLPILCQSVTINESSISLPTYGFGKGNPVPILAENPKIYPYFKFEEYEHDAKNKEWKLITLENDYIKVMVLPEIGGKVWGAIEKSTGEEFLYKNEVIKFRNIAMRGPWTSGGIEFNFGIIGHHPSTATPVDYKTQTNKDGSVSCFVSNTDLPSNTRWTVEIRLEKDKAYFETNATWYNASPLTESYYNWMTAAAVATNDLEFFIPGNAYVEHNGEAHPWPIDAEGRNLAMYKNNNFGSDKSYHIVGVHEDYFGGYYHDRNFGFGTWAPYEEMPGQKLWLWSQARSGGIWEDLLTDADGQYIEFQAGRLFDQYYPGYTNPISQVGFDPFMMDKWSEIWFPIKEIGGMEDASEYGVLNVETDNNSTTIGINALQAINSTLRIVINGKSTEEEIQMLPMQVFTKKVVTNQSDIIEIYVDGTELNYTNNPNVNLIKRPFYPDENLVVSESEQLLFEGTEALEYREYELAREKLLKLVTLDPSHQAGLLKLAELEYRRTNYDKALLYANTVLKMDTYNSGANYFAGITYQATHDFTNAIESLGWAARDIKYRSVAYAQMAEIYLANKQLKRAKTYANKALNFNRDNLNAREVLLLLHRLVQDKEGFNEQQSKIYAVDPLNHFLAMEAARMNNYKDLSDIKAIQNIKNEFKAESSLAIAIRYYQLGFEEEALLALLTGERSSKNELWKSYVFKKSNPQESKRLLQNTTRATAAFVFPFRRETVPVLEWAVAQNDNWKLKYYLAQNYIAVGLSNKGITLLKELGNQPDSDVFYRFRAKMSEITTDSLALPKATNDLQKALKLNPKDWKVWEENIVALQNAGDYNAAYDLSKKAAKMFASNYNIGLAHSKSLVNTGRFTQAIKLLQDIQILPFEHASESRTIYKNAHLGAAKKLIQKKLFKKALNVLEKGLEWPENIGVGKPYAPDERAMLYLKGVCFEKLDKDVDSKALFTQINSYTNTHVTNNTTAHFFGLLAAKKLGSNAELLTKQLLEHDGNFEKTKLGITLFKTEVEKITPDTYSKYLTKEQFELFKWAKSL